MAGAKGLQAQKGVCSLAIKLCAGQLIEQRLCAAGSHLCGYRLEKSKAGSCPGCSSASSNQVGFEQGNMCAVQQRSHAPDVRKYAMRGLLYALRGAGNGDW
jgi:hypothetical protein